MGSFLIFIPITPVGNCDFLQYRTDREKSQGDRRKFAFPLFRYPLSNFSFPQKTNAPFLPGGGKGALLGRFSVVSAQIVQTRSIGPHGLLRHCVQDVL